jgi:DNA invertase Pin-like site-specific DNA recombinase
MSDEFARKVSAEHLQRNAYLYVRQSTIRQVFEHTESTKRQYGLKNRAIALGWDAERITVIDSDLGKSGASSEGRDGFKRLVSEVGLGNAGIVIGLEVSRLARNSADWHRLLEICALTGTLILDEEGIYDPAHFNDRLLLGLKGTMSEAELHLIKARLLGGVRAKARRGELRLPLPIGFVYGPEGKVIRDPDEQIRRSIAAVFEAFQRTGSASATVKYFKEHGLRAPTRLRNGAQKGEVQWTALVHSKVIQMLHNVRYAGAFFYGRMKSWKLPDGRTRYRMLPQDQWHTLIKDAHESYISWQEYQSNQRRLLENAQAHGVDRRKSPPREGPALLQGMVLCGTCGKRMTVHYHRHKQKTIPYYLCQREGVEHGESICQNTNGEVVDKAVGKLVVDSFSPLALEVALTVQDELKARFAEANLLRRKHVERIQYETDLARRRYMQVDPENRLVADTLEGEWNEKLRMLKDAQEEYERQRKQDLEVIGGEEREKILALATDFPRLWNDAGTQCREKKRMLRLIIEDVTLTRNADRTIGVDVRFKGGAAKSLHLPAPLLAWELNRTSKTLIDQIDTLLDEHTDAEIADILNSQGKTSATGLMFRPVVVGTIRRRAGLKSRYERLREQDLLTLHEAATKLHISTKTLRQWADDGIIKTYRFNDRNSYLYELDGNKLISNLRARRRQGRRNQAFITKVNERINEVQCEV